MTKIQNVLVVSSKGGEGSGFHGHAGRIGLVGGSAATGAAAMVHANRAWILDQVFAKQDPNNSYKQSAVNEDKQLECIKAIASTIDGIVPQAHFDHLKHITIHNIDNFGRSLSKIAFNTEVFPYAGSYDHNNVSLNILDKMSRDVNLIVHEIGHHVSMYLNYDIVMHARAAMEEWKDKRVSGRYGDPIHIEDYGLRFYSTTDQYEFAADTYKVWLLAKAMDVRSNLEGLYKRTLRTYQAYAKYTSLDDLFTRTDVGNYIKK